MKTNILKQKAILLTTIILIFCNCSVAFSQKTQFKTALYDYFALRHIAPIVGYGECRSKVMGSDSVSTQSVLLGFGMLDGDVNNWDTGFLTLGCNWFYHGPFITGEYRSSKSFYNDGTGIHRPELPKGMLNIGYTGAVGGMLFLPPFPLAISGTAGLSTDFHDLFVKAGLGYNVYWLDLAVIYCYSLTNQGPVPKYLNGTCLELKLTIWNYM